MGQLATRLGELLREWGSDPASRQSELDQFAALEAQDEAAAQRRFHEMRRQFAHQCHAQLRDSLARFAFVRDAPRDAPAGAREIEREIAWLAAALQRAKRIEASLAEEAQLRASLRGRAYAAGEPLAPAAWDALAASEEDAEARRRRAARETRIELRASDAQRRAGRLKKRRVAVPDTSALPAEEADARLEAAESELRAAEKVEDSFAGVQDALRPPELARWRADSRRALDREAERLVALPDADEARGGLDALLPKAEALRVEAAKLASEAARSRRTGRAPPAPERRSTDAQDGYG